MAIKIELGELYGCEDMGELMHSIDCMKKMNFSDEAINEVLERSKKGKAPEEMIEVQIVDFMTEYITQHDVPSLIELVIKAIKKVEGSKNEYRGDV